MAAHALHHVQHIHVSQVRLLLLGSQRALGALKALLLVLLALGGFFRVLSDGAVLGVAEEDALLLWWLELHLSLFILFNQDGVDRLVNSLSCSFLKVLFFVTFIKVKNVFKEQIVNFFAFLLASFLNANVVACILNIGQKPLVLVLVPFSASFDTEVLSGWNELVNDEVLHSDVSCQFSDSVH